jgi:hypothetical protein
MFFRPSYCDTPDCNSDERHGNAGRRTYNAEGHITLPLYGFIWQQDNAPVHEPGGEAIRLQFNLLVWSEASHDLTQIEMAWSIIKRELRGSKFANAHALFFAVGQALVSILQFEIDDLLSSPQDRSVENARKWCCCTIGTLDEASIKDFEGD